MPNIFELGEAPITRPGPKPRPHPNALKLAAMKGQWVKVYISSGRQQAYNKGSEIRNGKIKGYAQVGRFEAMAPRPTPEGWVLWARCVYVNVEFRKKGEQHEDS